MTDKETGNSVSALLHPLVIINISDHATRSKVINDGKQVRVIGALLGNQTGKVIEISNSFELVVTFGENENEDIFIEELYLKQKLDQFAQVYPNIEFLGWYSTGSGPALSSDIKIQKQLMPFNENPIYLRMDSAAAATSRELPISIYESEVKIIDDQPSFRFCSVPYKIETLEAERIAVDHVAHAASSTGIDKAGSAAIAHYSGMHEAIRMLHIRIKLLLKYMDCVKQGLVPVEPAILRQIKKTCNLLPAINTVEFKTDLLDEYNNTLLITYMASVTKSINIANEVADACNLSIDQSKRRRFPFKPHAFA